MEGCACARLLVLMGSSTSSSSPAWRRCCFRCLHCAASKEDPPPPRPRHAQVRDAMSHIWHALLDDPKAAVAQNFDGGWPRQGKLLEAQLLRQPSRAQSTAEHSRAAAGERFTGLKAAPPVKHPRLPPDTLPLPHLPLLSLSCRSHHESPAGGPGRRAVARARGGGARHVRPAAGAALGRAGAPLCGAVGDDAAVRVRLT